MKKFLAILLLCGCSQTEQAVEFVQPSVIQVADSFIGMNERNDRKALKAFLDIDPARVEWCAAFVNSVLDATGRQGTNSLLARSFLKWGYSVKSPERGDIVVFPRGNQAWQGHVGFFVHQFTDDKGTHRFIVLGGNQDNGKVSYQVFEASKALDVRRSFTSL